MDDEQLHMAMRLIPLAAERPQRPLSREAAAELLDLDVADLVEVLGKDLVALRVGVRRQVMPSDLLAFHLARVVPSSQALALQAQVFRLESQVAKLQEQLAEARQVRYARVLPVALRRSIIARDGRVCRYCGRKIGPRETLHIDHVLPVTRGGSHDPSNLVVACMRCNSRKGALTPDEARMPLRA